MLTNVVDGESEVAQRLCVRTTTTDMVTSYQVTPSCRPSRPSTSNGFPVLRQFLAFAAVANAAAHRGLPDRTTQESKRSSFRVAKWSDSGEEADYERRRYDTRAVTSSARIRNRFLSESNACREEKIGVWTSSAAASAAVS